MVDQNQMEMVIATIRNDKLYTQYHDIIDSIAIRPDNKIVNPMGTNGIFLLYNPSLINDNKDNIKYSILHELEHIRLEHPYILATAKDFLDRTYELAITAAEAEVTMNVDKFCLTQDVIKSVEKLKVLTSLIKDGDVTLESLFKLLSDELRENQYDSDEQKRVKRMFRNIS